MNTELEQMMLAKGKTRLPSVLIAAAECSPLSKTGGLADVVGALPKTLNELGFDARVITPYHRCIKEKFGHLVQHICHIFVDLGWRHQYAGLEMLEIGGLTVYLVDSEYYFGDKIYRGGEAETEQYAFFQRAVMDLIPLLPDYTPEVLHCNDWHTAMLPFLVKTQYIGGMQHGLKTVLTIHNIAYQGWVGFDKACELLHIDRGFCNADNIGHYDTANFLKTGCLYADKVNTVSPSYADEIRTREFGEKLEDVLIYRGWDVSGILNGLDVETFNPATDPNIPSNYDADSAWKKQENKAALIEELGLYKVGVDTPIIAMVTRMTSQKGFDLVLQAMDTLMEQNVAFVLLGTGDPAYEASMREYERRYEGRLCAYLAYSESLSRRIYAGADFLLMPSGFEPCGLSQMIAMRYGTLPIVHEVGGLKDTVHAYNRFTGEGDGFSFHDFNVGTLLGTCAYALATYYDKDAMARLIDNAMRTDFSFGPSAVEYGKLFLSILDEEPQELRHDEAQEDYRSPFGAVRCSETVRLRLSPATDTTSVALIVNGTNYPMQRDEQGWFAYDYVAPATPGVVEYSFLLNGSLPFGANGVDPEVLEPWSITVYAADFETPDWAKGTVMYQIFPDRFAQGGKAFEKGVKHHRAKGRNIEVHEKWEEEVKYLPTTTKDYNPDDFFGGTLAGIMEKLPELAEFGVRCLYLNPIFESNSNHRYNTGDYMRVDPMLGTNAELKKLCAEAKKLGIRIVLDGVFSHTGDDSIYFNRYGRYEGEGAYQSKKSPYYPWYDFQRHPNKYRSWWGFPTLPEVEETNPVWQDYVVTGEDSVMRHWLRQGTSGWRLDVADELPDEVIDLMRSAIKRDDPDAFLLGEVWEDAITKESYGVRRRYALGNGLDSVMNYPLRAAILDFALGKTDAAGLCDFLLGQKLRYPAPMYHCLMNLMGSHDTARVRNVLAFGTEGKEFTREQQATMVLTKEQRKKAEALQKLTAAVQFALPGMPCIYYGDEEGMEGMRDPFCRGTYRKGGKLLHNFYAKLTAERNACGVLAKGDAAFAAYGSDCIVVLRYIDDKAKLFAINRGSEDVVLEPKAEDFRGLSKADAAKLHKMPALKVAAGSHIIRKF